jgi:PhzF family phenazine biosynthesis protein
MKTYKIKHVDAFTTEPFAGNPAGVVLDARGLTDSAMRNIARELNLSETAFVLPPTAKGADIQVRWFTPEIEVPLCGHATVAGFHALAQEGMHGMKKPGSYHFRVQTKSGILGVLVDKKYSGTIVEFQLPLPRFQVQKHVPASLIESLGIKSGDVHHDLPFVKQSYLYLPVKRLATMKALEPDISRLHRILKSTRTLGISVFTLQTIDRSSAVHSRFFAPEAGIVEDPVTGSANGPLGVYLYQYALPRDYPVASFVLPDGRIEFVGEQGDEIKRKGRVKIRLRVTGHGVKQVSIAGEAVTIMDSEYSS